MRSVWIVLFSGILALAGCMAAQTRHDVTASTSSASEPATMRLGGKGRSTKSIVYIIDSSGSMFDTFDFFREEIKYSVGRMDPTQKFAVLMVSDEVTEVAGENEKLVYATQANKRAFEKAIDDVRAQSCGDDLLPSFEQAFKTAFAMKPRYIYFLTDGRFDPKLLTFVNELNTKQEVRINTYPFVNREPSYEAEMQEMAEDNGGKCKFISEDELVERHRERSPPATTAAATKSQVTFCGLVVETSRVVYIIDQSGSLLDNLENMRAALKNSIAKLSPSQQFGIVVFDAGARIIAGSNQGLVDASEQNIERAKAAIDAPGKPMISGDLLVPAADAFEQSFSLRPDAIVFVTDGHFDPKLAEVVARLNKKHQVAIHTIAFVNREPSYEEQLKKMAKDNGGKYRFVAEKDLSK